MKQFIATKFFLALKEISQTGIEIDTQVLENRYDEFASLLFENVTLAANKVMYHDTLVFTREELSGLTAVLKKKRCRLSA